MDKLRVSDNHRYLVTIDGDPFFYLGDTAWELFHRLNLEDAQTYLKDRAAKGFTVIQAVVLAEHEGLTAPNANGDLPLIDMDPEKPNEAYFTHVDAVVQHAAELGLYTGMLPTWGDKWNQKWGVGPGIFTPDNAYAYGLWLGRRYAESPIIWILGGDRPVENASQREIIRAMAKGLREGDGGNHLMSFHPSGGHSSSDYWPGEKWLDFNMLQSGHSRNKDNYTMIAADYALSPVIPCMDAEPAYEDHPSGFDLNNGYLDDYDVRKGLYWSLFSGALGHTYGCHDIWQMWQEGRKPVTFSRTHWRKALDFGGAQQVQYARLLIESRPFLQRVPDQSLIVSEPGEGTHHVRATRHEDGSYALIYLPSCKPVTIDLDILSGKRFTVSWFDPRTGESHPGGEVQGHGQQEFTPPQVWPDWVLVLDNAECHYPPPGMKIWED
ncbi:MAG: DUF4038 domain-containing protein [Anaerolineales bacterium]|nr:MAG: DUF4038 domain-containing protein [Anaerolineales bacterium]